MRRTILAVVLMVPGLALVPSLAEAAPTTGPSQPNIYVACGIETTQTPSGGSCLTLQAALDAAAADTSTSVTIDLLPGQYCPVSIANNAHNLTIVGIGQAATGASTTGLESALSTFEWSSDDCTPGPSAFIESDGYAGQLLLQNLTVDGAGPTGGPTTGVSVEQTPQSETAGLTIRDVQVQHLTQGVSYAGTGLQLQNSAVVDNVDGLYVPGTATLVNDTFAGNTDTGVSISGTGNLINNTIAHNGYGLRTSQTGTVVNGTNNLIAANTTDCTGTGWEAAQASANNTNLLGQTCVTAKSETAGDIAYDGTGVATPGANGGPTASILPPAQAAGQGNADFCGPGRVGTDQREGAQTATTCDIGSVQQSASLTPALGSGDVAFGNIPVGDTGGYTATLSNGGGGLVPVESVELTGDPAFTLTTDGCTWSLLYRGRGSCTVSLTATPGGEGQLSGQLVFHTIAGDVTEAVTATGIRRPTRWNAAGGPQTIAYGTRLKLSDALVDTDGDPVVGASVQLMAKRSGASAFTAVASAVTIGGGQVSASVSPTASTAYHWSFAGTAQLTAAVGNTESVAVRPTVKAHLQKSSVRHGAKATLYGTVTPASARRSVTIQKKSGSSWKKVATVKIRSQVLPGRKGKQTGFLSSFKTTTKGTATYRVLLPAGAGLNAATSTTLTLHVT